MYVYVYIYIYIYIYIYTCIYTYVYIYICIRGEPLRLTLHPALVSNSNTKHYTPLCLTLALLTAH